MGKKLKKQSCLSILAALSLMTGGVAEAYDHQVISYDNHKVFDIIYFGTEAHDTWIESLWNHTEGVSYLNYDFEDNMKSWMNDACSQWAEIFKPGLANMKNPAQLIVGSSNLRNASALNNDVEKDNTPDYFKNVLVAGADLPYIDFKDEASYKARGYRGFAVIELGMGIGIDDDTGIFGWSGKNQSQLTHQNTTVDMTSVMFHELGHALGIYGQGYALKSTEDPDIGWNSGYAFGVLADDQLEFVNHLLDQNGNKARAGQKIVLTDDGYTEDTLKYINEHPEKYFQLGSIDVLNPKTSAGRAFFAGENVSKVLDGKTFWGIDGVPIATENPQLNPDNNHLYSFDLSHIELERSLMSHQGYRSYTTFMEAELALMQDIGYKIDRKNFYGKSIYKSGETYKNTQGFFARNDDGTEYIKGKPNTATLGVGLHIYGSRNTVTQTSDGKNDDSADLLACGTGAAGIRVDGVENTVTLAGGAKIEANGQNGTGIFVAYGRDHNINVEGNVSAMGDGGDGIRFDFGSGLAQTDEYRGSYIRYQLITGAQAQQKQVIIKPEDMELVDGTNIELTKDMTDGSFSDYENGDLGSHMGSLTVSGSVAGKSHAIYIDKSAFVDNINIEKGAKITGDIVSDWKHFPDDIYGKKKSDDSKLMIQYGTRRHGYDEYCKDLVTNLNVNGDFAYSGNITGSDNMKLKVNNGATMAYTGTADVVGVQVAQGAALYGGNYKVNEITKYAPFESVDTDAGKMINHGTIGALDGNSEMKIQGNLESDGTLRGYAGGSKGNISVTGTATLGTGSTVIGERGLPGENIAVLHANEGIIGLENVSGGSNGLLNYTLNPSSDNKDINAAANPKDYLEGATPQQMADYKQLNGMAQALANNPSRENELRTFYGLSDSKGLQAIDEMKTNDKEDSTVAVLSAQGSTVNANILSSRLATALGQSPAMMHIGANNLAEGEDSVVDVPVKLSTEQDNSAWVKFSRNWSRTAGGSNYTGNIITMGYDWKHGANQRNGFFGSYTDSSYGHNDGSEKLQDTRFGYYTGIHKGADTQLLYADFGYLKGKRSRNGVFKSMGTLSPIKGDYTGWLVEIGGEWKHALHKIGEKTWQVSPYGAFQMSYMKQRGYSESDTSLKSYNVAGGNNFYSALEGGVEFSRYMPKGSFNFRLGLRHALTGTGYEAHETNFQGRFFSKSSRMDKTHLVTSLAVETEFAPRWQLGAELTFQKGAHDRDLMASLQLRRMW